MRWSFVKKSFIPKAGLNHFAETFSSWAGVGFSATLVADLLDRFSNLRYASYYTRAINDAVGYQFWVLLSNIALLLFCVNLPLLLVAARFHKFDTLVRHIRRITYTFFLVAFDEGCLMIGILIANLVHTGDRIDMLASKSYLFSDIGFFSVLSLSLLNSMLWLLGEAVYNRDDHSVSGVVGVLTNAPAKYTIPGYFIAAGALVLTVLTQ